MSILKFILVLLLLENLIHDKINPWAWDYMDKAYDLKLNSLKYQTDDLREGRKLWTTALASLDLSMY